MNKLILLLFIILSISAKGQSIVDSVNNPSFSLEDSVAEKLAELFTHNPNIEVLDKTIEANLYEWKRNKLNWLPNLTPSFNINERNIKKPDSALTLYPRYNISLSFPLSNFFSNPKAAKTAKARYDGSIASKKVESENLKDQIKLNYKNYQTNKYLLALQETVLQDEAVLFAQIEQKFKKNEVSLEVFTLASKRYNGELVKKINLLHDVSTSKIQLENVLGMSLESALQLIKASK